MLLCNKNELCNIINVYHVFFVWNTQLFVQSMFILIIIILNKNIFYLLIRFDYLSRKWIGLFLELKYVRYDRYNINTLHCLIRDGKKHKRMEDFLVCLCISWLAPYLFWLEFFLVRLFSTEWDCRPHTQPSYFTRLWDGQ